MLVLILLFEHVAETGGLVIGESCLTLWLANDDLAGFEWLDNIEPQRQYKLIGDSHGEVSQHI